MEVKNNVNIVRLSIAVLVIIASLNDFVGSFYDHTIQMVANSDNMGYDGLADFRISAMTDALLAGLYIIIVLLHMKLWRGKFVTIALALLDLFIIVLYVLNMFEII